MGIERLLPDIANRTHKSSLIELIRNKFYRKEDQPVCHEFYNEDKTKRFCFSEVKGTGGFEFLDISLNYFVDDGWISPMEIKTRFSDKEEQIFFLLIEAVADESGADTPPMHVFHFDYETGGQGRTVGWSGWPLGLKNDDTKKTLLDLGFLKSSKLPFFIDFEKTAKEFLFQAKQLDFSPPVLYAKELLKSNQNPV